MSDAPKQPPAQSATPPKDKKSKDRSPNYPAIGLRKALEFAQTFWDHDNRQSVLLPRVAQNLGYGAKSSGGLLAISAMKKYGLLDDEGSGETRKVKLTETAITLLNPSAANRDALIKQAALKPAIHSELWAKFGQAGGSEGTMRDYLVFERKFFDPAATVLIGQFLDTIAFAKLRETDTVEETKAGDNEGDGSNEEKPAKLPQASPLKQPPPPPPPPKVEKITPPMTANLRYLPIPLDIGDAPIPVGMSEDDFQLLLDTLNLWKKKIVQRAKPAPNPTEKVSNNLDDY